MIFYNDKNLKNLIETEYKELENYKNSYNKRISLYKLYLNTMTSFEKGVVERNGLKKEELENKIKIFQTQVKKIDSSLEMLKIFLENININKKIEKKELNKYNQKHKEIMDNYINNAIFEEQITSNYINSLLSDLAKTLEIMKEKYEKEMEKMSTEKTKINFLELKESDNIQEQQAIKNVENNISKDAQLQNNNTLLISEKLGKVILPYRAEEVLELFKDEKNKYVSIDDVIKDRFTRNFDDFRIQFASRYTETMKLAREREKYSFFDAIALSTEMMKKRYLHPAIIAACKNLNELDVYLDCLDKNELNDFKIFKIKYELYPMVVNKNKTKKGTRYKESNSFKKLRKNKTVSDSVI